jgi:hypothetical protein
VGTIWFEPRDDWRERHRLGGDALRRAWGLGLGRIPWEVFVTLTFNPRLVRDVTRELASREAFWWLCHVARLRRRPVVWACAVERHKIEGWHAHAVLENLGRPGWDNLLGPWRERNGNAHVEPVYGSSGIAMYTTKQAAYSEVMLSDTITRWKAKSLASPIVVRLEPEV